MDNKIYSIGYGNLKIDDFILVLKKFDIRLLVDVRGKPYSKWNSSYIGTNLKRILEGTGIQYQWCQPLRGRTAEKPFEYFRALQKIIKMSESYSIALMCAELDPNKCHRLSKLALDIKKFTNVFHIYKAAVVDPASILDKKDKPKEKNKSMQLFLL